MNGSKRVSVITVSALGAVILALAIGLVFQRIAIARTARELGAEKRALAESTRRVKDYASWEKDYRTCSLKLGSRLPTCCWSDQMPYMVSQLAGLIEPSGLKMETLQPQPMSSQRNILRFPIRVGLQADLPTLTDMLEDVESTMPLLHIESLHVRNQQGKGDKLQVDMTISSFVTLDKRAPLVKRRAMAKTASVQVVPAVTAAPALVAKGPAPPPRAVPAARVRPTAPAPVPAVSGNGRRGPSPPPTPTSPTVTATPAPPNGKRPAPNGKTGASGSIAPLPAVGPTPPPTETKGNGGAK